MQLNQMEYFLAVAKHLNFTAAANELYISQPALSKQIALLETELGVKLFERTSRKVFLTEAGIQYQRDLIRVRDELEMANYKVMSMAKNRKKEFHIACFDGGYVNDFLPGVYSVLDRIMRDTKISLHRGDFIQNKKSLMNNEVDMLITLHTPDWNQDSLYKVPLCKRTSGLIYSINSPLHKKEPLSYDDFDGENYLTVQKSINPELYRKDFATLKNLDLRNIKIDIQDNFMTLLTNLTLGRGFAILTKQLTIDNPLLLSLPLKEDAGIEVIAIWKKAHPFAALLKQSFENKLESMKRKP